MANVGARFTLIGLRELQQRLRANVILADTWRRGLSDSGRTVGDDARAHAPRASGRLAAQIKTKVTGATIPRAAVISTSRVVRGFPVAQALNYSTGRYHYAGSRQSTAHWFTGALEREETRVRSILVRALDAIARVFNR